MIRFDSQPQQLSCPICYQPFDSSHYQPTIICTNRHTICAECVGSLQSFKCPFCRAAINFGQPVQQNQQQNIYSQPYAPRSQIRQRTCLQKLKRFLRQIKGSLALVLVVQFLQIIFDLIFAISDNDPDCMDNSYGLFFSARQYFLCMQIVGIIFASVLFIQLIFEQLFQRRDLSRINCFEFAFFGKFMLMMISELVLFFWIVKDHCSGSVYTYCLIQVILIFLFLLFVSVKLVQFVQR